jgi:hypothetical protein
MILNVYSAISGVENLTVGFFHHFSIRKSEYTRMALIGQVEIVTL